MCADENLEQDPSVREHKAEEADQFDDLMADYLDQMGELEVGQVTSARVVAVKKDHVLLDIGDKAEGIVDIREFADVRGDVNVAVGDEVEVVIQSRDRDSGQVRVSYRQARQRVNWEALVEAYEKGQTVRGHVVKALRNGVLVDAGVPCFLPASQLDLGRVENLELYVGQDIDAYVIDVDRARHRGVLSRRKLLGEDRKKRRDEALAALVEGGTVNGKVKTIVDYGVFVELQGIDALVPREEVAWEKRANLQEALKLGYSYKFKVLSIERERERVTLSRKQLKPDPWVKIETNYPKELSVKGTVINLTNNCAYVQLEDGIEGRIHRNNLSWSTSVRKPGDVVKKGDVVHPVVLNWDTEKRLLELGLKQAEPDPWADIAARFPINSRRQVKVIEVVPYGAFVKIDENTKGLIHVSDMSYDRNFKDPKKLVKIGDEIEATVLKIDLEQRKINLGLKQLEEDPFSAFTKKFRTGAVVTGKVKSVVGFGAFVELAPRIEGLLHISQWDREKTETLEGVVKPGDEVTVKITKIERDIEKISLSRRACLVDEERKELEQYKQSSSKGGTSLGSLLKGLNIDVK